MVGMVKFGGDLVSHGLVPVDGVMHWIHALLSEKHLSSEYCAPTPRAADSPSSRAADTAMPQGDEDEDSAADQSHSDEKDVEDEAHAKDVEEREVQLEVLCAIL